MPEGLQYSERGMEMEENISCLDEIVDTVGDAVDVLSDFMAAL